MANICGIVCNYNGIERGTLSTCLKAMSQYCDDIVVYDDGSNDGSIEKIKKYTQHVIEGTHRGFPTQRFKQSILKYIDVNKEINPNWILWLDNDEFLDYEGEKGIRSYLDTLEDSVGSVSLHEVNLWRSNCYKRIDSLFNDGWFVRLWRYKEGLKFIDATTIHKQPFPINLSGKNIKTEKFEVIHLGFGRTDLIIERIRTYRGLGMDKKRYDRYLNENILSCLVKYDLSNYPPSVRPIKESKEPVPFDRDTWRTLVGKDII